MSRKSKIDPALKVELVERYLEGEISAKEAGRLAGGGEALRWSFVVQKLRGTDYPIVSEKWTRHGPSTCF